MNGVTVTTSRRALAVSPSVWGVVTIWVIFRAWTSLWAALVSTLRPLTALEQSVALWPPSAPWGWWLQRALLAPWERWDGAWYLRIITEGYQCGNGTDAFHPLYPGLAWPLTRLGIDPLLSLMIVGSLATLAFLLLFERMAGLDSTPAQAQTASHLLLFFPVAFILFAPYNEGLFLLLSALTLLWARQHRWWRAGIAGALAVLTRPQGLFLVFPFAWELWEAHERDVRLALRDWRCCSALGLIPIGMGLWVLYRALVVGGAQLNFNSPYVLVYSMLISPSAGKVGASHVVTWPWNALQLALVHLWVKPDWDLAVNVMLSAAFVGLVLVAWPRLRASYRVYVLVMLLVSFSYHTGTGHPYMGLPRHLFLAFPVFIGLGKIGWCSRCRLLWTGGGFAGSCFLILLYVLKAWVP
ncbi:MAG: hypothetical protein OS130_10210 [Thermodesulfobacteriota bacterium]|nr:MAG: hypothetical protein OS130_10210 [Thermodesulfobacteriota bacterium]